MPRGFDCLMLHVGIGPNRKMRRLTDGEFRAFVAGVLPVAAESPVRGALLVARGEAAEAEDVAGLAGVATEVAASALAKLLKYGTLVEDPASGCVRVAQWEVFNPAPRPSEAREATRQRKQKQRQREKDDRDRAEREGRTPQLRMDGQRAAGLRIVDGPPPPPKRSSQGTPTGRRRDFDAAVAAMQDYAARLYPEGDAREIARAIETAIRYAKVKTDDEVRAYLTESCPELVERAA